MKNHCVIYRTRLKFDGRVSALIRTLAYSFPNEIIYLYEYPNTDEVCSNFPKNVKTIKTKSIFGIFGNSHFVQILKGVEYAFKSLLFLIKTKPRTIQVHHEIVCLGPLIYKLFNRSSKLVFNDEELYHPRDKNIPKIIYWIEYYLIEKCDLLISCNYYRQKAVKFIHKNRINRHLVIDNYVFSNKKKLSLTHVSHLNKIRNSGYKILLHQGVINHSRGAYMLKVIAEEISESWKFCFIGVKDADFNELKNQLDNKDKKKLINLGYIDYDELDDFYSYIDAAVIIYVSDTFNNKYCAPNRLYLAVNNGKPIVINPDNVTLRNFIKNNKNGIGLDNSSSISLFEEKYSTYNYNSINLKGKYNYEQIIPELKQYYSEL